ncbi:hypothetical protein PQR46_35340 [Paraburkholderia sediminicola]|uniref:hypothetical protein n=2 Tax=Paraburkholderia TaxID=1822464 RepID=UPI0038BE10E8
MVEFLKIWSGARSPDRTGVLRRIAIVNKSKCKDACQAARIARTSDGRYINRHYNLNPNWDASFMTVSSARSPCGAAALASNVRDSKRRDSIQGCEVDVADTWRIRATALRMKSPWLVI